jgi:hypothetical protein
MSKQNNEPDDKILKENSLKRKRYSSDWTMNNNIYTGPSNLNELDEEIKKNYTKINPSSSEEFSMTSNKKNIFKTAKGEEIESDNPNDMKKMMRLMKNRLSARKCREKKKDYIKNMEYEINRLKSELDTYKNLQKKEKGLENLINLVN